MKHTSSILTAEINRIANKLPESESTHSLVVHDFHIGALPVLLSVIKVPALIKSDENTLNSALEYLSPRWEDNKGLYFPPKISSGLVPAGFSSHIEIERQRVKSAISSFRDDIRFILTSESALSDPCFHPDEITPFYLHSECEYDLLIRWLIEAHYENTDIVSSPGQYSLRGGVIDIFPVIASVPVRINFIDEITEIYTVDIDSQLTVNRVKSLQISPVPQVHGELSLSDIITDKYINISLDPGGSVRIGDNNKNIIADKLKLSPVSLVDYFNHYRENPSVTYQVDSRIANICFVNNERVYIIPDWFDKKAGKQKKRFLRGKPSINFDQLEPGDYLIHNDYGICRYLGLKTPDNRNAGEYVLLEFEDNSLISLSADKIRKLSYYASGAHTGIVCDSLTKPGIWQRTKTKARQQAEEVVEALLQSYADRSSTHRKPYFADNEIEQIFLARFPFVETEDQKTAWENISSDLSHKDTPMNRLLCGDVGFGKTEIAIRAAFRVVLNGKQVAVLAPTTILVNQLFAAFCTRLSEFEITVDMISRFRTKKEITAIKNNLSSGKIDVIIGTHSLLADDVQFKNLGLLVIDEEQRFGVSQKEKIVGYKKNIDVLSMSATPIPRSLHISLSGIRDISTLKTAPKSRLSIQTQIYYYDIKHIKSAIQYEISRGGQVFFVHNEVKTIYEMAEKLREIFPYLSIVPAHGQETPSELEKTIGRFLTGKIDVLVCTSIIETGIDIPNANTIIINKAHKFGLSQLHQIRGRVGRSYRQAYAVMLIPYGLKLNRKAFRRLKAVEKHSQLGEGYNIALMDLDIRGAGTVFGYKQSGGAGRIGIELYTQFINEAIKSRFKSSSTESHIRLDHDQVHLSIFADSYIPHSFIIPTNIRFDFYRRISQSDDFKELLSIEYELKNRFGTLPAEVRHLLLESKLILYCRFLGIVKCVLSKSVISLEFQQSFISPHIQAFLTLTNNFFSNHRKNYWFKELKTGNLNLNIEGISHEDIPTIMIEFFNKLDDVFCN